MDGLLNLDISSDIEDVIKETDVFFYREIPYAMAASINVTMRDVRRVIIGPTFTKAFGVRNRHFAGVLWNIDFIPIGGTKSSSHGLSAFKKGGVDVMVATMFQKLDRDYIGWHAHGGTKTAHRDGGSLAIPRHPETLRSPTGRIRKPNKPINIVNKRHHFMVKRGGRPHLILKRVSDKENEIVYVFKQKAEIKKKFRFYEDAFITTEKVFPGHFVRNFERAIKTSRFNPYR